MVGQRRWEHAAAAPNRSRVRRRCYQCRQLEMVARLPCGVVSRACRGHTATLARLLGRGLGLGGGGWGTTLVHLLLMPNLDWPTPRWASRWSQRRTPLDTTRSRTFLKTNLQLQVHRIRCQPCCSLLVVCLIRRFDWPDSWMAIGMILGALLWTERELCNLPSYPHIGRTP
jgi:hypothetical protein